MHNRITWFLLLALVWENHYGHGEDVDCAKEPKCAIFRSHGMRAADCYDKNFYEFPKCLATDIEVIELSRNRIRAFTHSDLSRYSYIKILYLTDNLISKLEDDTFNDVDDLRSLDISINALLKLPPTIFQMSSLKTLVLRQNPDLDINTSLQEAKPISSPLTVIDISLTTRKVSPVDFPDFGLLPFLTSLNVTGNYYHSISPKHFAGLCNLNKFINNDTNFDFDDYCDCWIVNRWLEERGVEFSPFACQFPENKCLDKTLGEEDRETYDECRERYSQIQTAHKLTKIGIGIGITILVIGVISCLCFLWIRKKRNGKRAKKAEENNRNKRDGLTLLNNDPKSIPPNN